MQFINKAIKTSLCGVFVLWASSAWAAQKVALIIGNSQYQTVEDRLKNPVNDAKAIEKRLKELGFTTQLLTNANLDAMLEAINRTRSNVDKDGTVLFYYAGHGIQVDGKNYLVPVDARMANRDRVPRETVQVKEVIEKLNESSAAARIVIIDACRNDPFPKSYRSATRGLTRETLPVSKGLMVMYAASEGEVAEDGNGANGTFTAALLQSLSQPNIKLPELMDDVAAQVQQKTQNKQNPYSEGRGLSKLVLNSQAQVAAKPQVVERIVENPQAAEIAYWNSIKNSNNSSSYQSYLSKYPNGLFAEVAQAKLQPKPVQVAQVQVRDKPQTTTSNSDVELLKKGMWRDSKTNLVWMRCSLGQTWSGNTCTGEAKKYTWQQTPNAAKIFNNNGGFGGYKDWRIPHIEDLISILYCSKGFEGEYIIPTKAGGTKKVGWCKDDIRQLTINQSIFPNTKKNEDNEYWSSSTVDDENDLAWTVFFYVGDEFFDDKINKHYVRLVRSSQ